MTQDQLDILYELTITIHEHEWFGKREKSKNREEVQEWVSKKLASTLNIHTIPCGGSWGVLCTKDEFDRYWNKLNKMI